MTVGRFAPSPTGDLHFGSLVAAVASYLQVKSAGGKWLVRVEDIDPPREVTGSSERIIKDLINFGMISDQPVLFQSQRTGAYEQACRQLLKSGKAYWCGCSRADLPPTGVYPGTCREGIPSGKQARSIRVKVSNRSIRFRDRIQGEQTENLQASVGDFIIRRADGLYAYQLAVSIDDAFQNVTEVVRGSDLLDSTARQIHLQYCLGLPTPVYAHVPVVLNPDGSKLSKSSQSDPVRHHTPVEALRKALTFLGHKPPVTELTGTWKWAMANWSLEMVPRITAKSFEG